MRATVFPILGSLIVVSMTSAVEVKGSSGSSIRLSFSMRVVVGSLPFFVMLSIPFHVSSYLFFVSRLQERDLCFPSKRTKVLTALSGYSLSRSIKLASPFDVKMTLTCSPSPDAPLSMTFLNSVFELCWSTIMSTSIFETPLRFHWNSCQRLRFLVFYSRTFL